MVTREERGSTNKIQWRTTSSGNDIIADSDDEVAMQYGSDLDGHPSFVGWDMEDEDRAASNSFKYDGDSRYYN